MWQQNRRQTTDETLTGREILLVDKVKEKRAHICHRKEKVRHVNKQAEKERKGKRDQPLGLFVKSLHPR